MPPVMGDGQAVVGVTVKQAQAPMQSLNPQDQVHLVIVPAVRCPTRTRPPLVVTGSVLSASIPGSVRDPERWMCWWRRSDSGCVGVGGLVGAGHHRAGSQELTAC